MPAHGERIVEGVLRLVGLVLGVGGLVGPVQVRREADAATTAEALIMRMSHLRRVWCRQRDVAAAVVVVIPPQPCGLVSSEAEALVQGAVGLREL